jgi:hypothetical protein
VASAEHPFAKVPEECDAVMKGGITSGIVYPRAILELSRKFRFRSVGGTSAGAIAAAGAAAAELGRSRGRDDAFTALGELPALLGGAGAGGATRLFSFFQPQRSTAPLFRIAAAGLGGGWRAALRIPLAAVRSFPLTALAGALPAAWLACVALGQAGWASAVTFAIASAALAVGLVVALAVRFVLRLGSSLPGNFYGLCSGMPGAAGAPEEALVPWLDAYYAALAGAGSGPDDPPLTFGDLHGAKPPIRLEMMTTCLTLGRPFLLPFRSDGDVREGRLFYFRSEELSRLFPERIVRWMEEHPRPPEGEESEERRAEFAKQGLRPLPAAEDLPVIFAVRMSLSFPILLAAVPLWAVDYSRDEEKRKPERCWFSDGGICSNFPIHFFDSPLPRWPTFAINLGEQHPDHEPGFWMPTRNGSGIHPRFLRFETRSGLGSIRGLLGAILATMQGWNDMLQSQLPGYRDRIAHVHLGDGDGGLNLNMDRGRIERLSGWGATAGEELRERFTYGRPDCELDWENHRWVRLRGSLAALEELLRRIDACCEPAGAGQGEYDAWIRSGAARPSYAWSNRAQERAASELVASVRAAIAEVRATASGGQLADEAPRPRPELRVRPRI